MIKAEYDAVGCHGNLHGSPRRCLTDLTCEEAVEVWPFEWFIAEAGAFEGELTRFPMRRYRFRGACSLNELACIVVIEDP
jgi:hypothetical protein